MDFEENFLYQEGLRSETYQRPDRSCFQELLELEKSSDNRQASAKGIYLKRLI